MSKRKNSNEFDLDALIEEFEGIDLEDLDIDLDDDEDEEEDLLLDSEVDEDEEEDLDVEEEDDISFEARETELKGKRVPELREIAEGDYDLDTKGLRKAELIDLILDHEYELEDEDEDLEEEPAPEPTHAPVKPKAEPKPEEVKPAPKAVEEADELKDPVSIKALRVIKQAMELRREQIIASDHLGKEETKAALEQIDYAEQVITLFLYG